MEIYSESIYSILRCCSTREDGSMHLLGLSNICRDRAPLMRNKLLRVKCALLDKQVSRFDMIQQLHRVWLLGGISNHEKYAEEGPRFQLSQYRYPDAKS